MSGHEPNHRGGNDEIEDGLRGATFRPDAAFEERLRARLIEKLPEPQRRSWWQAVWDSIVRDDKESKTVRGSRLMGAFGLGVVALMAVLFVALVLVRPSGTAMVETPTATVTPDTQAVGMIFGGELELVEAAVEPDGGVWSLKLFWNVLKQPSLDYDIVAFATYPDQRTSESAGSLRGADLVSSNSEDWDLRTSEWQANHLIASTVALNIPADMPAPENVSIEVRDPESGWTLTLEYQGYSLSTIRAGVWSAATDEIEEQQFTATPAMPVAIPEIVTEGTPRAVSLSADGQWAAVESRVEGEWPQIHLHNLTSGEVIYVADGVQPQISDDGKWVVFVVRPREGDPRAWDKLGSIGLYDIERGEQTDITGIVQSADESIGAAMPAISGDGRFIVFMANKNLLPPEVTNGVFDVYLFDRVTTEMKRVDVFLDGAAYMSSYPSISADGNTIAFQVRVLEGATTSQVYVQDRDTEEERLIGEGYAPQISRDGSTVAYLRRASDGQGAGWINAYAVNVITDEMRWLGRVLDQEPDGGGLVMDRVFSLSVDGSRIAFWSVLENPRGEDIGAPPVGEGVGSIYETRFLTVYEWALNDVKWADHSHVPPGAAGWISSVGLSADGRRAAFVWWSADRTAVHVYWMALE